MATVPFAQNAVWTPEAASTLQTETFLVPARNLTKLLKLFDSVLSHYTDRDILAPVSVPIKLQSQYFNENLIFITLNKQL